MASPYLIGATSTAWATGSNWSTTVAPANGDNVLCDQNATNDLAGGDFTASNTLASLRVTSLFSNYEFGDNGTPIKVGATLVKFGEPSANATAGSHSNRINWDGSTIAHSLYVYGSKTTSTDTGKEAIRVKGVNVANQAYIYSGRVGFATDLVGDVATYRQISLFGSDAVVNIASGVTLTNLLMDDGKAYLYAGVTTATINKGTLYTYGSGAISQLNVAGTCDLRSSGTVALMTIFPGGNVTMLNDSVAKSVTLVKMFKGATLSFDPNVVTIPTIQLIGCTLADVKINFPAISGRLITVT